MKSLDKRADNLLLRLFAYAPRVGRQALEDYCTEALAWCLKKSPEFLTRFLNLTGIPALHDSSESAEVHTQMSFDAGGSVDDEEAQGGRFDLVIDSGLAARFVLVIETKVGSGFAPGQLKTYCDRLNAPDAFESVPIQARYLVTLTTIGYKSPDYCDGWITWPDVHRALKVGTAPSDALVVGVFEQFASFLEEKGLSMLQLNKTDENLLSRWIEVQTLDKQLRDIIERLRIQEDIKPVVGRNQVKSLNGGEWIGVGGKSDFWAGFGISSTAAGPELYLWVEISLAEDSPNWVADFEPNAKAAFDEAKRYLKHHGDFEAANFDETSSRFVFAKRVDEKLSGNGEAVFRWLYKFSQLAVKRASLLHKS